MHGGEYSHQYTPFRQIGLQDLPGFLQPREKVSLLWLMEALREIEKYFLKCTDLLQVKN